VNSPPVPALPGGALAPPPGRGPRRPPWQTPRQPARPRRPVDGRRQPAGPHLRPGRDVPPDPIGSDPGDDTKSPEPFAIPAPFPPDAPGDALTRSAARPQFRWRTSHDPGHRPDSRPGVSALL